LYDKSADLLRKSIALDPANSAEACNYLGYMWADHNMNLDEAELLIRRALESEPNNASYLDSLGWVEFRKGKFDRALDDLLHAARTAQHEDPVVFEHIGDTYLKLNRTREALEAWQRALALDPKNKNLVDKIRTTKKAIGKDVPANTNPT
jgi:tetratricopeptide (TPR) repeat protein